MAEPPILLIYDKDCPACNAYCQMVRIRQSVGEFKLVNAREDTEIRLQITAQRMDIDQGMVLKMGANWYYGSDAIYMLALLSSRNGLLNRLNYRLFKSKQLAKWLYPLLRFFRNLLLKLLGKRKINNLGINGNDNS